MLIGGWSNTISTIASWCSTRSRSSATVALPLQEVTHRTFERDPGARTRLPHGEERDRGERAEQARDRVGHRRTTEPGRIVAGRPPAARLGRGPVARTVVIDEGRD